MELREEFLVQIEEYAAALFSPDEIALILDFDKEEFRLLMVAKTSAYNRYHKGRLLTEAKVRKAIIDLATKGSSPAQILATELIKQAKLNEVSL